MPDWHSETRWPVVEMAACTRPFAGGDKLYGFVVDFLPIRNQADGAPVSFVFPEEGVSAVTEPVAIMSNARNPEAARAFVDFLLSEEGQMLASDMGYLPAHPDVAVPAGFPGAGQHHPDAIRPGRRLCQ